MSITINDSLQVNAPKAVDAKYMKFSGGVTQPYANTAEAIAAIIPAFRYRYLTVLILLNSNAVEYWWSTGVTDVELVVKNTDIFQNYTTGTTLTVSDTVNTVTINPSSVVSTLAITLPLIPHSMGVVGFYFGGALLGGAPVVTNISFIPPAGSTLLSVTVPTEVDSGEYVAFKKIGTIWYRLI